jgi:hypothetical protein
MGDQFRAAAFDEIASFGDDFVQDFENLALSRPPPELIGRETGVQCFAPRG